MSSCCSRVRVCRRWSGGAWCRWCCWAAVVFGFRSLLIKRFGASKGEIVQAVFVLFLAALVVLTVTGVWFRGPGMALTWPWG